MPLSTWKPSEDEEHDEMIIRSRMHRQCILQGLQGHAIKQGLVMRGLGSKADMEEYITQLYVERLKQKVEF